MVASSNFDLLILFNLKSSHYRHHSLFFFRWNRSSF